MDDHIFPNEEILGKFRMDPKTCWTTDPEVQRLKALAKQ